MKLSEVLKKHTVKELKEMAKASGVQGYSKLKKEEIIEKLGEALEDVETSRRIFLCADEEEMELFLEAMNREVVVNPEEYYKCVYFFVSGYYFLSDQNSIILPDEVKNLYEKVFTKEFIKEKARLDLILKYCVASANLYGALPLSKVIEIFNVQNDEKTSLEEISDAFEKTALREVFYYVSGEYLVHEAVDNEEELAELLSKQGDKPYFIPEKDELLKYAHDDYFERNAAFKNLVDYVCKNILSDEEMVEELCNDIQLACCFGEGPSDALNQFLSRDIEFKSEQEVYEVGLLISDLNNTTRMWCNRGFTPNELVEKGIVKPVEQKAPQIRVNKPVTFVRSEKKVGRNDPCPCGSGKKYKYCCGK